MEAFQYAHGQQRAELFSSKLHRVQMCAMAPPFTEVHKGDIKTSPGHSSPWEQTKNIKMRLARWLTHHNDPYAITSPSHIRRFIKQARGRKERKRAETRICSARILRVICVCAIRDLRGMLMTGSPNFVSDVEIRFYEGASCRGVHKSPLLILFSQLLHR